MPRYMFTRSETSIETADYTYAVEAESEVEAREMIQKPRLRAVVAERVICSEMQEAGDFQLTGVDG